MDKPFSQACENNKGPILEVLQQHLKEPGTLLEIGSGTGQHAAWLPRFLPWLHWQPSDVAAHLPGIRAWLNEAQLDNVLAPIELDVSQHWPDQQFDALFSANTFHIMAWPLVQRCIREGAARLNDRGWFLVYGPFNYNGQFTSDSNARFNDWLQARDPLSAIRDQEKVVAEMAGVGLALVQDHPMPANNRLLVFRK
jgi:cyclopropane fatty-acyl-phospholipid synthase-like methyltransferase